MRPVVVLLVLLVTTSRGHTITRCQLAEQLYDDGIAYGLLPDWVCLAIYESALNTSAVGGPNKNGSYDFGIFQINSRWWCGLEEPAGDCHIKCSDLVDDDITDDIKCAKVIYKRQGFYAWVAWKSKCKDKPLPDISHCFPSTTTENPAITTTENLAITTTENPAITTTENLAITTTDNPAIPTTENPAIPTTENPVVTAVK